MTNNEGLQALRSETKLGNVQPPKQQTNPTQMVFSIKCV